METRSTLIRYLNRYFAPEIWKPASTYLGNIVLSELNEKILDLDMHSVVRGVIKSSYNFNQNPHFKAVGTVAEDKIEIRIPGRNNRHFLKTDIDIIDPTPDPTVESEFRLEVTCGKDKPEVKSIISVDIGWISDFVLGLLTGGIAVAVKNALLEILEEIIPIIVENEISSVGGFDSYRFDSKVNAVFPDMELVLPDQGLAEVVFPEFSRNPKDKGYIDIVIISDGYTNNDIDDFNAFIETLANSFYSNNFIEPFKNFSSKFRFWKINYQVDDPNDLSKRFSVITSVMGDYKLNFSNIALIAELGIKTWKIFDKHPIIVVARKFDKKVDSNCQGPYILLEKGTNQNVAVDVLIHEIGHTPLGNYLADEYRNKKVYAGLEPKARNVTTNINDAVAKWHGRRFGNLLQFEGGNNYKKRVFRFDQDCRMSSSITDYFCKICTEELTTGILNWGHKSIVNGGIKGFIDLRIEYLEPFTSVENYHIEANERISIKVFNGAMTRFTIRVVGCSVPKNWNISWQQTGAAQSRNSNAIGSDSREFVGGLGSNITIEVKHDKDSSALIDKLPMDSPWSRVGLIMDQIVLSSDFNIMPPTNLISNPKCGSEIDLRIVDNTGKIGYKLNDNLWVAADIGGFDNLSLSTHINFKVVGDNGYEIEKPLAGYGAKGSRRRWRIYEILPPGNYNWFARTSWVANSDFGEGASQSRWVSASVGRCWTINELKPDRRPRPPQNPFEVKVITDFGINTRAKVIGLHAKSWDPNLESIDFEFQIKKLEDTWVNTVTVKTGRVNRDKKVFDSVAVIGYVDLPNEIKNVYGQGFSWRVKVIDNTGRENPGGWVEGPNFIQITNDTTARGLYDLVNDPRFEEFGRSIISSVGGINIRNRDLRRFSRRRITGRNP